MLEQLLVDASKKLPRPTDWLLQLHAYTHAHTHTHTPDIVTITTIRSKKSGNIIVSNEFLWIRSRCDYISLDAYYCELFCSRVRVRVRVMIRFSFLLVSGYA